MPSIGSQWRSKCSTFRIMFPAASANLKLFVSWSFPVYEKWQLLTIDSIAWSERKKFRKQKWWLSGGLPLALLITAFSNLTRESLSKFTASKWMKCAFSLIKSDRQWWIDEAQFYFITILGLILTGRHCRISTILDTIFCHIHHIHLIAQVSFSSILTAFKPLQRRCRNCIQWFLGVQTLRELS